MDNEDVAQGLRLVASALENNHLGMIKYEKALEVLKEAKGLVKAAKEEGVNG